MAYLMSGMTSIVTRGPGMEYMSKLSFSSNSSCMDLEEGNIREGENSRLRYSIKPKKKVSQYGALLHKLFYSPRLFVSYTSMQR